MRRCRFQVSPSLVRSLRPRPGSNAAADFSLGVVRRIVEHDVADRFRFVDDEDAPPQDALRDDVGVEILRRIGEHDIVAHGRSDCRSLVRLFCRRGGAVTGNSLLSMALIAAPWAFAVFIELDQFGRRRLAPGVALALVSLDADFQPPCCGHRRCRDVRFRHGQNISDRSQCVLAFSERAYGPETGNKSKKISFSRAIASDRRSAARSDRSRFDEGRVRRASTNKIAAVAGVSIGSLYQYFPSKEALVAAVIDRHMHEMMQAVRDALAKVATRPIEVAARELVSVMLDAHRVNPKLHRVLAEQTPRTGRLENIEAIDREAYALVRGYLEAHRDELDVADPDVAAFVCVTAVEALTHAAVVRRPEILTDEKAGRLVEEVTRLVVRFLRKS